MSEARVQTVRFGATLFLFADAMLFAGLIGAVIILHSGGSGWADAATLPAWPSLAFLLMGAAAMAGAVRAVRRGGEARGWLALAIAGTVLFGATGLRGAFFPIAHLQGLSLFSSTLLALALLHALHLILIVLLLAACAAVRREQRRLWVEAASLGGYFVAGTGILFVALLHGLAAAG